MSDSSHVAEGVRLMDGFELQRCHGRAVAVLDDASLYGVHSIASGSHDSTCQIWRAGTELEMREVAKLSAFDGMDNVGGWIATATDSAEGLARDVLALIAYVGTVQADLIASQREVQHLRSELRHAARREVERLNDEDLSAT